MLRIFPPFLFCPSSRLSSTVSRNVGAFGEQQQPHGYAILLSTGIGPGLLQLLQSIGKTGLICCHFSRHEDEAVKRHAPADDGNILQGLLQNDVNVAVRRSSVDVANPPEVQPVGINLLKARQLNVQKSFWEN